MGKYYRRVFLLSVVGFLGIILIYRTATETIVRRRVSRTSELQIEPSKIYSKEIEEIKQELNALKLEEQTLLSRKEDHGLRQELIEKRKQVAKLREELDGVKPTERQDPLKPELKLSIDTQNKDREDDPMESRFQQRKEHLENVCKLLPQDSFDQCEEKAVKGNLFNISHDIFYCSIEKSGSTFWRRILQVIQKGGDIHDPLKDLSLGAAYGLKSMKGEDIRLIRCMMSQQGKRNIVFVRSPYTRLFSGWLDKLYSTNTYYWNWGKKIIAAERTNPSNESLECGHDVKFSEFVHFVVKDVKKAKCGVDGHFSPSYRHCLPCGLPYNFIGKYETLKEDTLYLLEKFNLTHLVKFSDFEASSDEDAIKDASGFAFGNRKKVEKCMPFIMGLKRVWKRLQSRGVLHMEAEFPEKELSLANITEREFRTTLLNAYHSYNLEENKLNRDIALREAYSTVSNKTLQELHEAFDLDFQLFDYDKFPSYITPR